MRLRARRRACVAAVATAAVLACARTEREASGTIQVFVSARAGAGAPPSDAAVHLVGTTARGAPHDAWHRLAAAPDGFAATLSVPAGLYLLDASAWDGPPADVASAPAGFRLADPAVLPVGAQDHLAALVLDPATLAVQASAKPHPPRITSVTAAPTKVDTSVASSIVLLTGSATDKNGDIVAYAWTAAYAPALPAGTAPGVFSTPTSTGTSWSPPYLYAGVVTFTFTATDTTGAQGAMSVSVTCQPSPTRDQVVNAAVNNFPDVVQLTISDAQPGRGATTALAVVARDADGDPLAYAWDDGPCNGTFLAPAAASTTYVAPTDANGACRLAVTVTDLVKGATPAAPRGGTNTSALTINVGEPPARFAPAFAVASQSPPSPVVARLPVYFEVVAEETVGLLVSPVTAISWSDGTGRTPAPFVPLLAGDPTAVAWTPPPCAGATAPVAVMVTATATGSAVDPLSGMPLATSFAFPVQVACP